MLCTLCTCCARLHLQCVADLRRHEALLRPILEAYLAPLLDAGDGDEGLALERLSEHDLLAAAYMLEIGFNLSLQRDDASHRHELVGAPSLRVLQCRALVDRCSMRGFAYDDTDSSAELGTVATHGIVAFLTQRDFTMPSMRARADAVVDALLAAGFAAQASFADSYSSTAASLSAAVRFDPSILL
jgi:hypothetical protein